MPSGATPHQIGAHQGAHPGAHPAHPQASGPDVAPAYAVERPTSGHDHAHAGSQTRAQTTAARRGRPGLAAVAAAEKAGGLHLTREQAAKFLADSERVFALLRDLDPAYIPPKRPNRTGADGGSPSTAGASGSGEKLQPSAGVGGAPKRRDAAGQRREAAKLEKLRQRAENARRDELDGFRERLQPYSAATKGFPDCGRLPIPFSSKLGIPLTYDGKRARWTELQRCRKVHVCPTCGQEIRATRRGELEQANRTWVEMTPAGAESHTVGMATFTMRHFKNDSLADLLVVQRDAWSMAFGHSAGQHWRKIRARFGIVGDVRVWETTWGARYGWHPHWHVQYFLERPLTPAQVKELEGILAARWTRAVVKAGGKEPDKKWAVKLIVAKPGEEEAFADYMTKEMTGQGEKEGRKKGQRTPHQIAQDWLARVENLSPAQREALPPTQRRDLALWREYETAVHGVRYMRWSHGLKALLGIDTPDDDEELETGEEQAEKAAPTVLSVTYTAWFRAIISRRGRSLAVRQAMEQGGVGAVQRLVDQWNREEWDRWWRTRPEKRRGDGPLQLQWGRDVWEPGQEPALPVPLAELSNADPGQQLLDALRQQQAARDAAKPQQLVLC